MGEIESVAFVSYEETEKRFQLEWQEIVKQRKGKKP